MTLVIRFPIHLYIPLLSHISLLFSLSPRVLMHGGHLGVTFCLSLRLSVRLSGTGPKFTRKNHRL